MAKFEKAKMTIEELQQKQERLNPMDADIYRAVLHHWDSLAKPLDGLGDYERLVARIGSIQRTDQPTVEKRVLLVFLSDNGVVEEGVSQSDASVTLAVAEAMRLGNSTVCVMAEQAGVDVHPVDVGMQSFHISGIENRRVRKGTRNFLKEPAMTVEETLAAIDAGYQVAKRAGQKGYRVLLLGEMGIGNTTTATAIGCVLLGVDPLEVTGRGAGLSAERLERKCAVIEEAIQKYEYDDEDALQVLSLFGGYDIAAMVGVILAGAEEHLPVVVDGLITLSAVLVAERLFPSIKHVCIASHRPKEPMGRLLLDELGFETPIDANLALGEGTGAVLLVPQLDVAMALYDKGTRFEGIGVQAYQRYQERS